VPAVDPFTSENAGSGQEVTRHDDCHAIGVGSGGSSAVHLPVVCRTLSFGMIEG
jgi:hypothetical protein